jgi:sugar-specific transcriptional regulator TrmB|tara:strand:+ start:1812 stop:2564 length:753 start_codon:yes stop_codon:yes gene_type:complete
MNPGSLENIGLTEGESKVYLALLRMRVSTIGNIIKEARVSNSKVYNILDRLSKKGLVGTVIIKNKRHFEAKDPSRLKEFIKLEEKKIIEKKGEINELMPKLQETFKQAEPAQEAEILQGINGIKTFTEMILKNLEKEDTFYILGAPKEATELLGPYFKEWHKERAKKGVDCKILYNWDSKERAEKIEEIPKTEVRFLPKEMKTPALIDIGKGYVATILFGERPICFVIKNRKIAESYESYFKLLWKISKR